MLRLLLVLLLLPTFARGADPDPASLFPPGTIAYAELRSPAAVAPVLAGWFAGTPLDDGLKLVHDRRDAVKDIKGLAGLPAIGAAAVGTAPELFRELARLGGAAAGLTGFSDKHEPLGAAAVLFGDSAAAGLLARGYLLTDQSLRRVDTVGGVPVFQHRNIALPGFGPDGKPLPLENTKPTEGKYELTYAYRPGLFVVGTGKAAVADVLARYAAPAAKPSLASDAAFKKAAAGREKPGVFVYAVPPAIATAAAAAKKDGEDALDADLTATTSFLVNPKAVPVVAGHLTFAADGLGLSVRADVDPAQPSPVLALLTGATGQPAPSPGVASAVSFAFPPGDRAKLVLAAADAVAKAGGNLGQLPSEAILPEFRSALGRVAGVTLVLPEQMELPKGVAPLPLAVVRADSQADAAVIVALVPKLVATVAGADSPPTPAVETIAGVRVLSLSASGLPQDAPLHYAHAGSVVVAGLDRKWVAKLAVLTPPPPADGPAVRGWFNLGALSPVTLAAAGRRPAETIKVNEEPGASKPANAPPATEPTAAALLAATFAALPPAEVRAGVGKPGFAAEVNVRGLKAKMPAVVAKLTAWLEQYGYEAASESGNIPRGLIDR